MIPKVIHYCWYGGAPESELMQRCFASWRKFLPEYEVRKWDENNSPMRFDYLQTAAGHAKWSNMSNLVRLFALLAEGGIYLDTDIEVLKPLDDLLTLPAFLGCECNRAYVNTAVFGCERGHPFPLRMLAALTSEFDGREMSHESSPMLASRLLSDVGFQSYSEIPQMFGDVMIFPTRFFYPYAFRETFHPSCLTPDTYTIHYWAKRWT